jgi:hypothetical protein
LPFIAGEHHPAIFQDGRMQGTPKVEVPDLFDIITVLIHHEELKIRESVAFIRPEAVTARGEHDPPPRQGTGPQVEGTIPWVGGAGRYRF